MNYLHFKQKIRKWAEERNILELSPIEQLKVLREEISELELEVYKKDIEKTSMEWADCMVVLTIMSEMLEIDVEKAFDAVVQKLNKRKKGAIIDGKWRKTSSDE